VRHPFRGDVSYPIPVPQAPLFRRYPALSGNRHSDALVRGYPPCRPAWAQEHSGSFNRVDFTGDNVGALLGLSSGIVLAGLLEEDDIVPQH
jgi:hypothetical protein